MDIMDDLFASDDEGDLELALPQGSTLASVNNMVLDNSEVFAELRKKEMGQDTECEVGELKDSGKICGKLVEHIDKHMQAHHGEKVVCPICNQSFSIGYFRLHLINEHSKKRVTKSLGQSNLCEENFVTRNALKNHLKQIHAIETSTFAIKSLRTSTVM